ncbi:hypothetical protein [Methylocucumis oryzae]|uniref:hypothetical protein n=1 Tax=Methylocucumis oryzae TaxID=1632867 RepID=UPI001EF9CBDE|nr:hypothetical protein [Methylocucumis oryzae]
MKQSFFLVIPKQHSNPQRLKEYEGKILAQWISELPIANPILAVRLIFDYLAEFNSIKMPAQLRLDALEMLIPSLFTIEEFLRTKLMKSGFPKDENDKKTLGLLVALQRQFTLSYWIIAKELTQHEIGWFQSKNAVLAIVRCIKGLSAIVASHLMMGMPVPSWIWMDLHALYKLSIKIKKHTTQIALNETPNKNVSPEEAYLQILLLSLADPTGLMQNEIKSVYQFVDKLTQLVSLKTAPVTEQPIQCLVLVDEDIAPFFSKK